MKRILAKNELKNEDNSYTINMNKLLSEHQFEFTEFKNYPLTKIDLNKDYFKDKDLEIFERYIGPRLHPINRCRVNCYFGKIKDEGVYFYLIDGTDGFEFETVIRLYYSDSLEIVEENMEYSKKRFFWERKQEFFRRYF